MYKKQWMTIKKGWNYDSKETRKLETKGGCRQISTIKEIKRNENECFTI